MRRARLTIAAVVGLLACGDRTTVDESAPVGRSSSPAGGDPVAIGGSLVAPPSILVRACLTGDPAQAIPWALDSVAVASVVVEGIESLAARDSARLVARIARMVDVLPSDTTVADFRGLPVTVRAAWRLAPTDGDTVVVALVVRRMPMESAPLEELFAIVAAPGQRQGVRDPLVEHWVVRQVGPEERLVARELAGAYLHENQIVLAFAEDADDGVRVALVERREGRWSDGWTGPLPACIAR